MVTIGWVTIGMEKMQGLTFTTKIKVFHPLPRR